MARLRAWPRFLVALVLSTAAVAYADAPSTAATESMVIALSVNGEPKADLFVHRSVDGDFLIRQDDLALLGLQVTPPAALVLGGEAHISLRSIPGLTVVLDERRQRLEITAPPSLLARSVIDASSRRQRAERITSNSAFLNWAALASTRGSADAQLTAEGGVRLGPVLIAGNGHTIMRDADTRRFVRLMTTAAIDVPETLQRWSVGDLITGASELGGNVNIGGFALTKLYSLDPYQIRYPIGAVRGQALLASEVEVYVDGQRVRTERVRPGEFEINELTTQQGARNVQLVVRDAFGRVQQFDYSLYTSDQLLRKGLGEYQYAVGALRRGYGSRSFEYGPVALVAHHRHGVCDDLTLGLRAEGRPGLVMVAPSGTLRLGAMGVVAGALAFSRAEGIAGQALMLQYAYQSPGWGLGASVRRESAGYAPLTDPLSLSNRKWGGQLYIGRNWADLGTVWLSHAVQTTHEPSRVPVPAGFLLSPQSPRRSTTLGYATYLQSMRGSFRAGLSRVSDERGSRNEVNLTMSIALDSSRLMTAGARRTADGHSQTVQLNRALPLGEGWGYDLSGEHASGSGRSFQWRGAAQLNTPSIQLRGDLRTRESDRDLPEELRLAASGGIVWIEGNTYFGRPVHGSFALVRVGDLKDVPVTLNGIAAGVTDGRGQVFLPRISPHYASEIGIDSRNLPIDYSVAQVRRRVVLPERSGAVIDFEASRVQAVVGRLVQPRAGRSIPVAGTRVRVALDRRELQTITGSDGELYLENLPQGHHEGQAESASGDAGIVCRFRLEIPATDAVILELGAVDCVEDPRP